MATEAKSIPRFEIRPLTEVEGGGYLVEFPDYPGCVADGATPEEALREGIDALTSYCRTLDELGRPVPTTGEVYGGQWRQTRAQVPSRRPRAARRTRRRFAQHLGDDNARGGVGSSAGVKRGQDEGSAVFGRQHKSTVC